MRKSFDFFFLDFTRISLIIDTFLFFCQVNNFILKIFGFFYFYD